ncbi:MAG: hypothetical protein JNL67_03315 [Planctomycetaceae bacterium]|nr:hypothetical protein [Planctomycetaceae bacterium]
MKIRFSLKQIFGLALIASVFWTIFLCAFWGYAWALGATTAIMLFGLVGMLSFGFAFVLDRMAFLFYRQ